MQREIKFDKTEDTQLSQRITKGEMSMVNSRQLKFKAWDKNEKVMCLNANHISPDWFNEHPNLVPLQHTGLRDKNGVEIYEGDIISYQSYRKEEKGEVRWGLDGWWIWNIKGYWEGASHIRLYDNLPEGEVIGNIYENPELIGEK